MRLEFYAFLFYFGGLLIPAMYLVLTLGRGLARKGMLIGAGIDLFWRLAVCAFVYYAWRTGCRDYYDGWVLLWPINIVSSLYYVSFLAWKYANRGIQQKSTI